MKELPKQLTHREDRRSKMYKLFSLLWIAWCFIKIYSFGAYVLLMQIITGHNHIKDLPLKTGKVAIVTGGDTGIGYEVSKGLVSKNVHVIIACRTLSCGKVAQTKIREDFPNAKIDVMMLDLANFKSIKRFVDSFMGRSLPLHILVNNAGVMFRPYTMTENHLEHHFQVNYLGHLYLTQLLLQKLKDSGADNSFSRIINVSSAVHALGTINMESVTRSLKHWEYSSHAAYADSKLAVVMATYCLQNKLSNDRLHVTVNALHPGVVNTNLYQYVHWSIKWLLDVLAKLIYKTAEQGAEGILYLALSDDMETGSGCYYDNGYKCHSSALSYNEDLQDQLWTNSLHIINSLTEESEI